MATRNRPDFFRQALRCFLRQTYSPAELIVVDDGERPVAGLCRGAPRVRYIRFSRPSYMGTKLNAAVACARGSILQKLDDDDYYGPDFLTLAASHLSGRNPKRTLVAWDCFLVWLAGARKLRWSGHGWQAGGTLCFSRQLWRRHPFRDAPCGVDSFFIEDNQPEIVRVCAPEQYLVVRHGANTWNHMLGGEDVDHYFRRLPVYAKSLAELVEPEAQQLYIRLAKRRTAPEMAADPR